MFVEVYVHTMDIRPIIGGYPFQGRNFLLKLIIIICKKEKKGLVSRI